MTRHTSLRSCRFCVSRLYVTIFLVRESDAPTRWNGRRQEVQEQLVTTRKRPTQTLGIASLAWAVFLALVMLSVQTVAQASPLDEAIPEMRRYCMEEVCFGMTVDEVSSLPHRGFALQNRLDEAMQC